MRRLFCAACLPAFCAYPDTARLPEPSKQFGILERHIARLRTQQMLYHSEIIVMVERNLGNEAEHHERHFNGTPGVRFRIDHAKQRFGIQTTEEVKYAMCTLTNNMLRDQRLCFRNPLLSEDPDANRKRIREQLQIYSYQFKAAQNVFGKQRVALCGKVGGMKDDAAIALQLAIYYSKESHMYA